MWTRERNQGRTSISLYLGLYTMLCGYIFLGPGRSDNSVSVTIIIH
jgi:hypothetical protein